MTHEHAEEILPGIVLGICPLPAGWHLDVAMVLACGARLAVIDTGVAEFMPQALAPALAACGRTLAQVELIVNTHAHWDHVQGNAAIRAASGAPVCIPAPDAADLAGGADRLLADGEILDLGGGLRFTVIATPGHSPGMACLYEPERKLLIVSDAVQGPAKRRRANAERGTVSRGPRVGNPAWPSIPRSPFRVPRSAGPGAAACGEALFGLHPGQGLSRLAEGTLASELADRDAG